MPKPPSFGGACLHKIAMDCCSICSGAFYEGRLEAKPCTCPDGVCESHFLGGLKCAAPIKTPLHTPWSRIPKEPT